MQVTNMSETATSIVASKNKSSAYSFANTPEAFSVFFATLYKDPLKAFVREAICNAWDSHIEADNTDTPLNITVTKEYLIVEDFGVGIPPEKMHEIYCVIGSSTKKTDSRQTGGFGYGCKSPFAYTDNFEVITYHSGFKSVYRLLKADPKQDGFPSCTQIVQVPSDKIGLTVKIPIDNVNSGDVLELVTSIAYAGSIKANVNNVPVETFSMSTEPNDYFIGSGNMRSRISSLLGYYDAVFVRYGNVVYPINDHPEYKEQYDSIRTLLSMIYGTYDRPLIILQAEPNSLAITPNREELSMQPVTIASIVKLFDNFLEKVPEEVASKIQEIVEECEEQYLKNVDKFELLINVHKNTYLTDHYEDSLSSIKAEKGKLSIEQLALLSISRKSKLFAETQAKVFKARKDFIYTLFDKKYHLALDCILHKVNPYKQTKAFYKTYNKKATLACLNNDFMKVESLYVWEPVAFERSPSNAFSTLLPIIKYAPNGMVNGVLLNKVVVSYTKSKIYDRLSNRLGRHIEGILVYVLPNKNVDVRQQTIDAFTKAGYEVEDLTTLNEDEITTPSIKHQTIKAYTERNTLPKDNPVFKGNKILSVANIFDEDGEIDIKNYRARKEPIYISEPEVVIHVPLRQDTANKSIPHCYLPAGVQEEFFQRYKDKIGIVTLSTQYAKAKTELGFKEFLSKEAEKYYTHESNIKDIALYKVLCSFISKQLWGDRRVLNIVLTHPEVQKFYKLPIIQKSALNDPMWKSILNHFYEYDFINYKKFLEAAKQKVKIPKKWLDFTDVVKSSCLLDLDTSVYSLLDEAIEMLSNDINKKQKALGEYLLRALIKFTNEVENEQPIESNSNSN